jgi:acetyl-CoA carboxylase carboxyltransferase component
VIEADMRRFDAIHKARDWVASLKIKQRFLKTNGEISNPLPPRYPIDDILSLVNPDIRKAFDMKEVVLRLVDDSRLAVFKPKYGVNILTTWAHIMGKSTSADARNMADWMCRLPGGNCGQPDFRHQPR